MSRLVDQLKFEEGLKLVAYKCSEGHLTIGYGRNLEAKPYDAAGRLIPHKIDEAKADELLLYDVGEAIAGARRYWLKVDSFDKARRDAFVAMCFQLGVAGFMSFHKMRKAAEMHDWPEVKRHALDSEWARQTPERAARVTRQLLTGQYYEVA